MVDITAQNILDENDYTKPSTTIVEQLADNAIDHINAQTGLSIQVFRDQAGAAGSRTISVTANASPTVKLLAGLFIRAYNDKGPVATAANINVSTIIADPQYNLFMKIIDQGINRLRGRSFKRT